MRRVKMSEIVELFSYNFFINALITSVLTSLSCGIIGTYVVSKRMVFISGGITHASFGGIGIGYYLGINPVIGASIFAVLSAMVVEYAAKKNEIKEDSIIGIVWSLGMAIGIIFVFLTPGYVPNLNAYLFGSILTVSKFDINAMLILVSCILLFFFLFFKEILYISFDEEYVRTKLLPVGRIKFGLIILVALTIVINIRVVGVMLVISLFTIPQAIASLFTQNFRSIMIMSAVFSFVFCVFGLILSYWLNIPSGATIIFVMAIGFIIFRSLKLLVKKLKIKQLIF
jgi:zinc transport system permease protein